MRLHRAGKAYNLRVVAEHPGPLAVNRVAHGHIGVDGAGFVVRVEAAEAVVIRPLIVAIAGAVYSEERLS